MIEIQAPLTFLTLDNLRTLSSTQKGLQAKVTSTITDASARIDKIRKAAASGPDKTALGEGRTIGTTKVTMLSAADRAAIASVRSIANRQSVREISNVRDETDKVVVPVLKTMQVNANLSKQYSERHWDIGSILRRAKCAATGTSGLTEAMALRQSYTAILREAHPLELSKWGQWSIDVGDTLLQDCVARENFSRTKDDRAFGNAQFLMLCQNNNTEYTESQAVLSAIVQSAEIALTAYAAFGREIGAASLRRISLGLAHPDMSLNEDGSIQPRNIPAHYADAGE